MLKPAQTIQKMLGDPMVGRSTRGFQGDSLSHCVIRNELLRSFETTRREEGINYCDRLERGGTGSNGSDLSLGC